jgi:hypothetical protein
VAGFLGAACLSTGIIDIVIAAQTVHGKSVETILSHIFQAEVIAVFTVGAAGTSTITDFVTELRLRIQFSQPTWQ